MLRDFDYKAGLLSIRKELTLEKEEKEYLSMITPDAELVNFLLGKIAGLEAAIEIVNFRLALMEEEENEISIV